MGMDNKDNGLADNNETLLIPVEKQGGDSAHLAAKEMDNKMRNEGKNRAHMKEDSCSLDFVLIKMRFSVFCLYVLWDKYLKM